MIQPPLSAPTIYTVTPPKGPTGFGTLSASKVPLVTVNYPSLQVPEQPVKPPSFESIAGDNWLVSTKIQGLDQKYYNIITELSLLQATLEARMSMFSKWAELIPSFKRTWEVEKDAILIKYNNERVKLLSSQSTRNLNNMPGSIQKDLAEITLSERREIFELFFKVYTEVHKSKIEAIKIIKDTLLPYEDINMDYFKMIIKTQGEQCGIKVQARIDEAKIATASVPPYSAAIGDFIQAKAQYCTEKIQQGEMEVAKIRKQLAESQNDMLGESLQMALDKYNGALGKLPVYDALAANINNLVLSAGGELYQAECIKEVARLQQETQEWLKYQHEGIRYSNDFDIFKLDGEISELLLKSDKSYSEILYQTGLSDLERIKEGFRVTQEEIQTAKELLNIYYEKALAELQYHEAENKYKLGQFEIFIETKKLDNIGKAMEARADALENEARFKVGGRIAAAETDANIEAGKAKDEGFMVTQQSDKLSLIEAYAKIKATLVHALGGA